MLEYLFNKPLGLQLYERETPTKVFSCEICEIFKNTFLKRTPLVGTFVMRFKYNFISASLILKIKMDVDFKMFAATNDKKFQEMSILEN